jgi:hypothetical protein
MAIVAKSEEQEVTISKLIAITDFQGDKLRFRLSYDSREEPEGAALLQIDLEDVAEDGTWITENELREIAALILVIAEAMKIAGKKPPVKQVSKFGRK